MTNPREPLTDTELEECVQRSATLLERGKASAEVVMRALALSVAQIVSGRVQQPNIVDQILQQQPPPGAFSGPPQPQPQPQPHPFYGAPGRSRPVGIPDPGAFGPQNF